MVSTQNKSKSKTSEFEEMLNQEKERLKTASLNKSSFILYRIFTIKTRGVFQKFILEVGYY